MKALGRKSIASFIKLFLDAVWWLVSISLGLLLILLGCSFFLEPHGTNLTLSIPVAVQLESPIHGLDSTDAKFEKLHGNLKFPVRKGAFFSGSVFLVVLMFGFLLWVVTRLRCVFRSLSRGAPFAIENARRIRQVGLAVIFGEAARAVAIYFWSYYTSQRYMANGLRFVASVDISVITIIGGLAILVIAEVFQEGARLQEDQSLTI